MFPSSGNPMSKGLDALVESASQAFTMVAVIMMALFALSLLLKTLKGGSRSGSRRSKARAPTSEWKLERAVEQVRTVEDSGFERKPLLNREEARLLPLLERAARDVGQGHRVMAQTSLGEVIRPTGRDNYDAFSAINSKRLDFAIFDRWGMIVCALEYQGTGHYQQGAAFRDTVKREALRKAGVRMLEVYPEFEAETLAREVKALLTMRMAG